MTWRKANLWCLGGFVVGYLGLLAVMNHDVTLGWWAAVLLAVLGIVGATEGRNPWHPRHLSGKVPDLREFRRRHTR